LGLAEHAQGVLGEILVVGGARGPWSGFVRRPDWCAGSEGSDREDARDVGLGAEPARLSELHWLSLLLKAVDSAGGIRGCAARSLDGAGDRFNRRPL
jgi:hypothetical protein